MFSDLGLAFVGLLVAFVCWVFVTWVWVRHLLRTIAVMQGQLKRMTDNWGLTVDVTTEAINLRDDVARMRSSRTRKRVRLLEVLLGIRDARSETEFAHAMGLKGYLRQLFANRIERVERPIDRAEERVSSTVQPIDLSGRTGRGSQLRRCDCEKCAPPTSVEDQRGVSLQPCPPSGEEDLQEPTIVSGRSGW